MKNKILKMAGTWLSKHPSLWVNPMCIPNIFRAITGSLRILPDFLIIGAAKSGTTSLYNYLINHPSVYPSLGKEIYFFDRYYTRGIRWYRGNFYSRFYKFYINNIIKSSFITGESTPTYLHHPLAPERISKLIPLVKLIVLLRNPIDRGYSHYQMEKQLGFETMSFEDAIKAEENRLDGETEKMIEDHRYYSYNRQIFSYLTSGIYVDQLVRWMKFFPKKQFLILKAEDFDQFPQKIFKEVEDFLQLPHSNIKFVKLNVGKYGEMNPKTRTELIEFFRPHNEKLYKFLERDFQWN